MRATRALAAGLARRALAYLLDCALLAGLVVTTQLGLRLVLGSGFPALATGLQIEAWVLLTVSLPIWFYFAGFESSVWQATPAKRLLGLRVTTLSGQRQSRGRALLRTVVKLLPWELTHLTLLLPTPLWDAATPELRPGLWIVYGLLAAYLLCAAFTSHRQAPHDLMAGTLVVPGDTSPSST